MEYERRLGNIVGNICSIDEADWYLVLDDVIAILLSYDLFYAIANWAYCAQDMDFEMRLRSSSRYVFLGWHNVEVFMLTPKPRVVFYASGQVE